MTDYLDILDSIGKKDPAGLEKLYQAYGSRFYSYCIKRWQLNEEEAWEVVYRTLETLVLKLSGYRFESKAGFEGFLFTVLANYIRQYYRSARKRDEVQLELMDMNQEEELPGLISKQIARQAFTDYYKTESVDSIWLQKLRSAMEQLDDTERSLLLLRAQEYTYEEIAALLGIDNNQLKVKHHRARRKLVNLIGQTEK